MADEQPNPQFPSNPTLLPIPGRAAIENLDSNGSDPDTSGGKRRSEGKEQGPSDNRREPGGGGGGQGTEERPQGARVLPASGSNAPATSLFTSSDNILKTIADRFIAARDLQKAAAWRQLQRDLMEATPYICPAIIPYKDAIQLVADIEKELKGTSQQTGRSNEEILASFLSGGDEIPVPPIPAPIETLDTPVKMVEG